MTWAALGTALLMTPLAAGGVVAAAAVMTLCWFPGPWSGVVAGMGMASGFGLGVLGWRTVRQGMGARSKVRIGREEAPALFRMLDEWGEGFSEVWLMPGFEWSTGSPCAMRGRREWVVGLTLLDVMPVEELQALLAHERRMMLRRHRRAGTWVCWLRRQWAARRAGRWFDGFRRGFELRVQALAGSLVLEADAEVAGSEEGKRLASALCRLAVERARERRFRSLHEGDRLEDLPRDFHERLEIRLARPWNEERCRRDLLEALGRRAPGMPALEEQLVVLGVPSGPIGVGMPRPVGRSATAALLDAGWVAEARAAFSRSWWDGRQAAGEGVAAEGESVGECWDRIAALARLDGLGSLQPEILALLGRAPEHPGALYLRGCHLVEEQPDEAMDCLGRAAEDPTMAPQALAALARLHDRRGEAQAAAVVRERAQRHVETLKLALVERGALRASDEFHSAALPPDQTATLAALLQSVPGVRAAWLVSKRVEHFPGWPHHVLVIDPEPAPGRQRAGAELVERLSRQVELPGYVHFELLPELAPRLVRAIRRASRGALFRRRRPFFGE